MNEIMLIGGLVLLICISSSKVMYKIGVPMLLIFIILGMLFGVDGIVGIKFNNYEFTKVLCSMALAIIMFYGGFGTNWKMAKPVAVPSLLMSTVGLLITALLTGVFCHYALGMNMLEGLLIGAILSSTDAASVFATLRSQKLNLKGSLASVLEVESGSNDPFAYMLTMIVLTLMSKKGELNLFSVVIIQIVVGIIVGILLAKLCVFVLRVINFEIDSFYNIFVVSIAILSFSVAEAIGGNGFLSVYIAGLVVGNSKIPHKRSIFHFFDGISWIMQIALFFVLGLLASPSKLPEVLLISFVIALFIALVSRPIATFVVLGKFKFSLNEKLFVSWVGLRGAASIAFAIFAVTYGTVMKEEIFHIVFVIALFSVAIQGTLIPILAKKLKLVDNDTTVLKTFNDYKEDKTTMLLEVTISEDSKWANKSIMDANIPEEILIVMLKRQGEVIIPKGNIVIREGDILVLSGNDIEELI